VPGATPRYPPECKREAVRLCRSSGKAIPKRAVELGITSESLRRWIRQHEIDAGERKGFTTDEPLAGAQDAPPGEQDPQTRKGVPEKATVFFAKEGTR
jgi:transposase